MSPESVSRMVDATPRTCGRVDVLVNNASTPGGMVRGPLADADDKTLLEDIDTTVVGSLRCAKAVARTHAKTERRAATSAIRRIVDASEIGQVVAFRASARAGSVTGVAIDASGGSIPVMFQ